MLAYEKCYVLTSTSRGRSYNNHVSAHEPKSDTNDYLLSSNWWLIPSGNCSRATEIVLAAGERSRVPTPPRRWVRVGDAASLVFSPQHPARRRLESISP